MSEEQRAFYAKAVADWAAIAFANCRPTEEGVEYDLRFRFRPVRDGIQMVESDMRKVPHA